MEKKRVALQENSPGWSDSVTAGIGIGIISGIGASDSVAFCTTVGIFERSGRLRSKSPVADNLFPWVRSRLRHALTHGYSLESLRDSVICTYLNRIARAVRPYLWNFDKPLRESMTNLCPKTKLHSCNIISFYFFCKNIKTLLSLHP